MQDSGLDNTPSDYLLEHIADQAPKNDLIYYPILLVSGAVFALLLPYLNILDYLFSILLVIAFHELGHAVMYWLFGIPAVPTYFFSVAFLTKFSPLFFFCFLSFWAWVVWASRKANYLFLYYGGIIVIGLLFFFSFIVPFFIEKEILTIYGGLGGELILSTVVLCAFFAKLPKYFNWKVSRYVVGFITATVFWHSSFLWIKAIKDHAVLPMGAMIDFGLMSGGPSSGDLDKLIRDYHWDVNKIIGVYLITALVCLFIQIAAYLVSFIVSDVKEGDIT